MASMSAKGDPRPLLLFAILLVELIFSVASWFPHCIGILAGFNLEVIIGCGSAAGVHNTHGASKEHIPLLLV